MRITCTAAAVALMAASQASADGLTFADAALAYEEIDGDDTIEAFTLLAEGVYEFGDFTFFGGGQISQVSVDDFDLDLTFANAGVTYSFGAIGVGAELVNFSVDDEVFNEDEEETLYTIFGEYSFGPAIAGLAYTDGDDLDEEIISVFATYDLNATDIIGASYSDEDGESGFYLFADINREIFEVEAEYFDFDDTSLFAIEGVYRFANGFGIIGEYATIDDDGDDLTSYAIGGLYEVQPDLDIFLTLGQAEIDDDDADTYAVGVRYNIGKRKSGYQSIGSQLSSVTSIVGGI